MRCVEFCSTSDIVETLDQPNERTDAMQPAPQKPTVPAIPLHDPRFPYIPAARTDVQATWARFGWTPPSKAQQ